MLINLLRFSLAFCLCSLSFAANSASPNSPVENLGTNVVKASQSHRLMLDGGFLLVGGIGLGYEKIFSQRLSAGPFVSVFKLNSSRKDWDSNGFDFNNEVSMIGLRGRYFVSNDIDKSGVYFLGGISQVSVKSEVKIFGDSANSSDSTTGVLAGAGYQFAGSNLGSNALIFNLGGQYATGYAVVNSARSSLYGPAEIEKPKIQNSIYFEASAILAF